MSGTKLCGQLVDPRGPFEYGGRGTGCLGLLGTRVSLRWSTEALPSDSASLPRTCLFHMKASSFLDNCVMDMCSFQGLQQMLCVHMSAMTATCQDAGYAVGPWRGPQFCRELGPGALGDDVVQLSIDTVYTLLIPYSHYI